MKNAGQNLTALPGDWLALSRHFTGAAFCLLFVLAPASRSMAVSYLQEGFNYAPGILGINPPWINPTNLISVTNSGLAYPYLMDFSPPANTVTVSQGSADVGNTAITYRPLTTAATNGSVYFSFLINFTTQPGNFYILGLTQRTNTPPGGKPCDPLDLIDEAYGTGFSLGIRTFDSATGYLTNNSTQLNLNTPYLVVLKYNFTNGTASMYVNPPAGNTEPALPDAISIATNNLGVPDLSYVYMRVGSSSAGNFMISALRVASTWPDVTPATNAATAYSQAATLSALLDSLQVQNYWMEGTNVDWLTGVAGALNSNPIMMTEGTATHCSAFAGAVSYLLNVYLLRQPAASDILLANNQANWLATNTTGWFPVTNMAAAQHLVNTGALVVASYLNPDPSQPGHIAILRPSNRTDFSVSLLGPEECQSGDINYADTNISTGFGGSATGQFPNEIKYYAHTVNYPIASPGPAFNQSFISNRMFIANIATIVGRPYQAQWSTNLTAWTPLLAFTNANNSTNFSTNVFIADPLGTRRFYRILAQ